MPTQGIDLLVINAAELVTAETAHDAPARGADLNDLQIISGGAMAVDGGRIVAVGTTDELLTRFTAQEIVDAAGCLVSPSFVDPHTHLLYGGTRHIEWEGKVLEQATPNIDTGIRTTIDATRAATDEQLLRRAHNDLDQMLSQGTTVVEIKSGYGLDVETELRLLRLARELDHPVQIFSTYLGAHTVPGEFLHDRSGYVDTVVKTLPEAATLADYCDIACDPISFTEAESRVIAQAAHDLGFPLRFHADQTGDAGGTDLAVEFGAISVDHLDATSDAALINLAKSSTIGIVFPGANFHMMDMTDSLNENGRSSKDLAAWAQRIIQSGAAIALSTDFNPGTAPSTSMQTVMQLAARLYRWSFAQIWHMTTINAAAAVQLEHETGSLRVGKRADFVVWSVPTHGEVIYRFGSNLAREVFRNGIKVADRGQVIAHV